MKKIMFNDRYGLTQAVIEGRKAMTRRLADPKQEYERMRLWHPSLELEYGIYGYTENDGWVYIKPKYRIGETVAVAQSYCSIADELENCNNATCAANYEKNVKKASEYISWMWHPGFNNKMFVEADLMPYQIRITGIRVERLQDISDEDCMKEGIFAAENVGLEGTTYWYPNLVNSVYRTPREAYAALIDKVSGKGTWSKNPYVFVYDFELVK